MFDVSSSSLLLRHNVLLGSAKGKILDYLLQH
jgi:hypothetical protein